MDIYYIHKQVNKFFVDGLCHTYPHTGPQIHTTESSTLQLAPSVACLIQWDGCMCARNERAREHDSEHRIFIYFRRSHVNGPCSVLRDWLVQRGREVGLYGSCWAGPVAPQGRHVIAGQGNEHDLLRGSVINPDWGGGDGLDRDRLSTEDFACIGKTSRGVMRCA